MVSHRGASRSTPTRSTKAATDIVISRSDASRPVLKNTLKLTGACWLSAAAHMGFRAQVRAPQSCRPSHLA